VALAAALGGGKKGGARARSSGDARSTVLPKYRNPADPSQTWAGRGARPKWIELDPSTSKPLAKFLIPTSS
jgi:DNA-binding protein H-NS